MRSKSLATFVGRLAEVGQLFVELFPLSFVSAIKLSATFFGRLAELGRLLGSMVLLSFEFMSGRLAAGL